MPHLLQRLPEAQFRRGGARPVRLDLAPYRQLLEGLAVGEGALVELEEGETQRVVKRRLTIAAHERSLDLHWLAAPTGQLRFQLRSPKSTATPPPTPAAATPAPAARQGRARRSA